MPTSAIWFGGKILKIIQESLRVWWEIRFWLDFPTVYWKCLMYTVPLYFEYHCCKSTSQKWLLKMITWISYQREIFFSNDAVLMLLFLLNQNWYLGKLMHSSLLAPLIICTWSESRIVKYWQLISVMFTLVVGQYKGTLKTCFRPDCVLYH